MKPILVFYHVAMIGNNWKAIVDDQLKALEESYLPSIAKKVYVSIVYDSLEQSYTFPEDCEIIQRIPNDPAIGEGETIELMRELLKKHKDSYVLYFHTKGISYPPNRKEYKHAEYWRKFMEYALIKKWKDCVDLLSKYKIVCASWLNGTDHFPGHATGNFYWADSNYLLTKGSSIDVPLVGPFISNSKCRAEFWLGYDGAPYTFTKMPMYVFSFTSIPENVWGDYFYKNYVRECDYIRTDRPIVISNKPKSALITKYLGELYGIEIGRGAQRDYGLNTLNVDGEFHDIFNEEQVKFGAVSPAKVDIVADASSIPLADSTQSFIFSSHVFEHLVDPIAALIEWYRLVKNKGYVAIVIPNMSATKEDSAHGLSTLGEIIVLYQSEVKMDTNHLAHITVWSLESMRVLLAYGKSKGYWNYNEVASADPDDHTGDGFAIILEVVK